MVKALAISFHSGNCTFAPSGWFMHAWSHILPTCKYILTLLHKHYVLHFEFSFVLTVPLHKAQTETVSETVEKGETVSWYWTESCR